MGASMPPFDSRRPRKEGSAGQNPFVSQTIHEHPIAEITKSAIIDIESQCQTTNMDMLAVYSLDINL